MNTVTPATSASFVHKTTLPLMHPILPYNFILITNPNHKTPCSTVAPMLRMVILTRCTNFKICQQAPCNHSNVNANVNSNSNKSRTIRRL